MEEREVPTRIIKWRLDFYRGASLESVFAATDKDWALIQASARCSVYLGEVNGKHSDVTYNLDLADFEVLSDSPDEVRVFARIMPKGSGFDILGAVREVAEADAG